MDRFWRAATSQAGREFGARHYRWFLGARVARGVAPVLLPLLGALGLIVAVVAGYRWLSPDWPAIGSHVADWGSAAGVGLLWVIGTISVVAAGLALLVYVWRNWWRLSVFRPMRIRRPLRRFRRF